MKDKSELINKNDMFMYIINNLDIKKLDINFSNRGHLLRENSYELVENMNTTRPLLINNLIYIYI